MNTQASQAADALAKARRDLFAEFLAGRIGRELPALHARLFDDYFRRRLAECPKADFAFAVVAVGGYGRSELCPHSDIDVLIVVPGRTPGDAKGLAQCLFFPLWDLGVDLGHGVRGIKECMALAAGDYQVLASLLDARFLAGEPEVFAQFELRLKRKLLPGREKGFKSWLEAQNERRRLVYGDASGLLEPDLKEGLGGLRDIHQVRWLADMTRGQSRDLLEPELGQLADHLDFLLLVRNHLHLASGRKTDRASLEAQRELADRLGFTGEPGILPVEAFLTRLQRVMGEILALRRSAWSILAREYARWPALAASLAGSARLTPWGLEFAADIDLARTPRVILDIFGQALHLGSPLSLAARRAVGEGLEALGRFSRTPEGGKTCFDFLLRALLSRGSDHTLREMLDTGVFEAIVPGFARVAHLVQYDMYHIHPVGRHTLETILEIKRGADPSHPWHRIFMDLPHPERLFLGALFHDIGKGLGGGHSEKGARIAREALTRLGMDEEAVSDVSFLVLRHLQLVDTATGRDLSDRDVVAACAAHMGTRERLDMLLLLTVADATATGPPAWSSWKESLVGELYDKTRQVLDGGGLFDASEAQVMLGLRDKARARAGSLLPPERLEARLDAMPPRYMLTTSLDDILEDMALMDRLETALEEDRRQRPASLAGLGVAIIVPKPLASGHGWTITVAARHHPALFACMAGVLALYGVNIQGADIHLWQDGTELHRYHTANPPDTLFIDEVWARVRQSLRYALRGKLSLDAGIAEKRTSPLTPRCPDLGLAPSVEPDNGASEYYTLLTVRAADRLGLLHDIAVAIKSQGLEVHLAKIDTLGNEVRDVFYVRDERGRKIADSARLQAAAAAILDCLACDPARQGAP